jgi:hypothetical protein
MFRPSNELKLANPHAVVHSPAAVSFLLISLSIFSLWGFLFCALYVGSSGRAQVFYLSPLGRDQVEDTVFSCKNIHVDTGPPREPRDWSVQRRYIFLLLRIMPLCYL